MTYNLKTNRTQTLCGGFCWFQLLLTLVPVTWKGVSEAKFFVTLLFFLWEQRSFLSRAKTATNLPCGFIEGLIKMHFMLKCLNIAFLVLSCGLWNITINHIHLLPLHSALWCCNYTHEFIKWHWSKTSCFTLESFWLFRGHCYRYAYKLFPSI